MKYKCVAEKCKMKCTLKAEKDISPEVLQCVLPMTVIMDQSEWVVDQCPECEGSNCKCQQRGQ